MDVRRHFPDIFVSKRASGYQLKSSFPYGSLFESLNNPDYENNQQDQPDEYQYEHLSAVPEITNIFF